MAGFAPAGAMELYDGMVMVASTPLFTQHSRQWQNNRYVYPVISRRSRGLSVGVNLNPDKACNFDCVYCSVDRTTPGAAREVDLTVLRAELDDLLTIAKNGALFATGNFGQTPPELRRINDIAFSGDGEPTSAAEFADAVKLSAELLSWHHLDETKIVVITNATLLDRPEVSAALAFLDTHNGEIWAKLDAGSEEYYQRVDRSKIPLQRVLNNLLTCGKIRPIVIQSLFMRLDNQSPDVAEIKQYVQRLRQLRDDGCRIRLVQIYTTARATAETFVTPLPNVELDAIAARVRELGIDAQTFYGPV